MRIALVRHRSAARQLDLFGPDRDGDDGFRDRLARLRDHDRSGDPRRNRQPARLARLDLSLEQIDVADELGDPARSGRLVKVARGCDLFETAGIHHADPARHHHRLLLIVGDDDEGRCEPPLQFHQFELGAFAQLLVERGHRLVEQQNLRAPRQRAGQCHALFLTAGELIRLALLETVELDQRDHLGDAGIALRTRHAGALQTEGDIVAHGEMGKQRIVLEHHVDRALVRQNLRDVLAAKQNAAFVRRLKTGEHPQ